MADRSDKPPKAEGKLAEKHYRKIESNAPKHEAQPSPEHAEARPIPSRHRKPKAGGAPIWMTTYLDVTTLLLTFLVLMLASADFREKAFGMIGVSSQESFPAAEQEESGVGTMARFLTLYDLQGYVRVVQIDGRDALAFKEGVRFPKGSRSLSETQKEELYLIHLFAISRLPASRFHLIIRGGSEKAADRPLALASQRAIVVADFLENLGIAKDRIEVRTALFDSDGPAVTEIFAVEAR